MRKQPCISARLCAHSRRCYRATLVGNIQGYIQYSFAIYRATLVGNIQGYIQYSVGLNVQAPFRISLLQYIGLHSLTIYMATHSTLAIIASLHVRKRRCPVYSKRALQIRKEICRFEKGAVYSKKSPLCRKYVTGLRVCEKSPMNSGALFVSP